MSVRPARPPINFSLRVKNEWPEKARCHLNAARTRTLSVLPGSGPVLGPRRAQGQAQARADFLSNAVIFFCLCNL
jgi:hypothetical protein